MSQLNNGIQEGLVALLCFDNEGGKQVRQLVEVKYYDQTFRPIAELADNYWQEFNEAPGEQTWDLIESLKEKRPEESEIFDRVYRSIVVTSKTIKPAYFISRARKFVRKQKIKSTIMKAVPLLARQDDAATDELEALLSGVGKEQAEVADDGILLNDPFQALSFLNHEDDEVFPMGIKPVDEHKLGPIRGGLHLTIAGSNVGKTWSAVQQGKYSLLSGNTVLHISLEMSKRKIAQRYVQALFALSRRQTKVVTKRFNTDELGRFTGMSERVLKDRPSLDSESIHKYLTKKLKLLSKKPRLIIQDFPTGQLTIRQLKAYMDHLESSIGFIPDHVLIDYPDLMDIDPKHKRESTGKIYIDLRGIGVERNLAMSAFSQANRLGLTAKLVDLKHTAEDISKIATADTAMTINQTKAEQALGLARLFFPKAREEKKNLQVIISQAFEIGQFCIDASVYAGNSYNSMLRQNDEESEEG